MTSELEPQLQERFAERLRELKDLADGPGSLPAAREQELQALAKGERLLAENATLSGGLTEAVDRLVTAAKGDITAAGDEAATVRRTSTGVLLAAHTQAACRADWLDRMLATMLLGNAAAAGVGREFDVRAVTDVTGFGLAGHLLEMLRASGVDARVTLGAVPLLDGFAELSGRGVRSSLDPSNRESEHAIDGHTPELRASARYDALFDPQTSGGLLLGCPRRRAAALEASFAADGEPLWRVGEVVAGEPGIEVVQGSPPAIGH